MSFKKIDAADSIELWTRNGPCEIHLMQGDITLLPVEQKMDIIMVSAFPGDYAAMTGTVLGALKNSLKIDVGKLSYDKELDLRHHFSCWLSKPITTKGAPYKKVLCFERRKNDMPVAAQISDMFRVFTPVFNNQDHTVITPLLTAGHQGSNRALICKTMVAAAAHWITAGLPLRCLKIVSYDELSDEVLTDFKHLKAKYLAKTEKLKRHIFTKKFDVYITFNPVDDVVVKNIMNSLKQQKSDVKVCSKMAHYDKEKVWQDHIFKLMVASKRIIAVLSTSFMESSQCLEQYNMAMCCNRLVGMEVLAPFYIENITSLPTYMGLVQWIDCRVRKDGETSEGNISKACSSVLKAIEAPTEHQLGTGDVKVTEQGDKAKYDVFISYSHRNPEHAEKLLKTFNTFDESVKVFYDRSSLTTGVNWQSMLYQSLGECRCVIALLSPAYLASTMCMEEYSLGLARYLSKDNDMTFIPMCVEQIDSLPAYLCKVPVVNAADKFGIMATKTTEMVCRWLGNYPAPKIERESKEDIESIEKIFCEQRTKEVKKQYWVYTKFKDPQFQRIKPLTLEKDENATVNKSVDIALIYANDAMHMAGTFCSIIDSLYSAMNISVQTMGDHKRMEALDKAKRIVIFLSQELLHTSAQMSELHLALCRQRQTTEPVLYLIKVTELHGQPFFPRILPFDIACTDPVWELYESTYLKGKPKNPSMKTIIHRKSDRMQHSSNFVCNYGEFFAITKAAEDVLEFIVKPSGESAAVPPILMNVIACDLELHDKLTLDLPISLPAMEEEKERLVRKASREKDLRKDQDGDENLTTDSSNNRPEESNESDKDDDDGVIEKEKSTYSDLKRGNSAPITAEQGDTTKQVSGDNLEAAAEKSTSSDLKRGDSAPIMGITEQADMTKTKKPVVEESPEAASVASLEKKKHGDANTTAKHNTPRKTSQQQQMSLTPVQEEVDGESTARSSPDPGKKHKKNGVLKKARSKSAGAVKPSQKSSSSCAVL